MEEIGLAFVILIAVAFVPLYLIKIGFSIFRRRKEK